MCHALTHLCLNVNSSVSQNAIHTCLLGEFQPKQGKERNILIGPEGKVEITWD